MMKSLCTALLLLTLFSCAHTTSLTVKYVVDSIPPEPYSWNDYYTYRKHYFNKSATANNAQVYLLTNVHTNDTVWVLSPNHKYRCRKNSEGWSIWFDREDAKLGDTLIVKLNRKVYASFLRQTKAVGRPVQVSEY